MQLPLERLQSDFAAALLDPGHAAGLLAALANADPRLLDRLALYRGNVTAAREKALANAYPVVRALVGEEFFAGLARAYGHAHPSRSGDLNVFGERFAAFVAAFEHARSLPYLADVAALEWSVHRAHYAADADPLARDRLGTLAADRLLGTRFSLHPACAWIGSAFPVASIWRAHQPGATVALPDSVERREFALVVRPRWRVDVLASSAGEIAALEQLRQGADMGCAIGAALDAEPRFDFARTLVRWIDHSIVVDMDAGAGAHGGD
jgi:uncharacterized protein